MLPDVQGYEVIPDIRLCLGEHAAILVTSMRSDISVVQLCVRRGADAYLIKPLRVQEIQHMWQYVKGLPEGSFTNDIAQYGGGPWRLPARPSQSLAPPQCAPAPMAGMRMSTTAESMPTAAQSSSLGQCGAAQGFSVPVAFGQPASIQALGSDQTTEDESVCKQQ